MSDFHLLLTDEEKAQIKQLAMQSITDKLDGIENAMPRLEGRLFERKLGAFVTLKKEGHLRGCIGNVQGSAPLCTTIWEMARAAAFSDPRFPPVSKEELASLSIEISILGPVNECHRPNHITIGTHGLIATRGSKSGLLLPQVATENNWDRETFLSQTCIKAGLPSDAWRKAGTTIFWFEAIVF